MLIMCRHRCFWATRGQKMGMPTIRTLLSQNPTEMLAHWEWIKLIGQLLYLNRVFAIF